jgi:hypothetical protein
MAGKKRSLEATSPAQVLPPELLQVFERESHREVEVVVNRAGQSKPLVRL